MKDNRTDVCYLLNRFVVFQAGLLTWRMPGLNFRFHTSPMTFRSSLWGPCTEHLTWAKLASLKVQLERYVCVHNRTRTTPGPNFPIWTYVPCSNDQCPSLHLSVVLILWLICVYVRRVSLWVWYVEHWAGSQTTRRRKGRRRLLCCRKVKLFFLLLLFSPPQAALHQSLTGSLILSKKRQSEIWCQSWRYESHCILDVTFMWSSGKVSYNHMLFIRRKSWNDRSERNGWNWSETMFSLSMRWRGK